MKLITLESRVAEVVAAAYRYDSVNGGIDCNNVGIRIALAVENANFHNEISQRVNGLCLVDGLSAHGAEGLLGIVDISGLDADVHNDLTGVVRKDGGNSELHSIGLGFTRSHWVKSCHDHSYNVLSWSNHAIEDSQIYDLPSRGQMGHRHTRSNSAVSRVAEQKTSAVVKGIPQTQR